MGKRNKPSIFSKPTGTNARKSTRKQEEHLVVLPELETEFEEHPVLTEQTNMIEQSKSTPSDFSNADGMQNGQNNPPLNNQTKPISIGNGVEVEEVKSDSAINENVRPSETDANWSPLSGDVVKRDYANNYGTNDNDDTPIESVEEPSFQPPPPPPPPKTDSTGQQSNSMTGNSSTASNNGGGNNNSSASKPEQTPPLNPDMADLSDKDKKLGSTMMVDAILNGYKQAWGIVHEKWVKISDEDIMNWVMQDKISMDITIPIGQGEEVTIREFINTYNETSQTAFLVTDEFIDSVRDSMIREFSKRGWGITDMQNILQAFIRDSGAKAMALFSLKSTMNNILKQQFLMHQEIQEMKARSFGDLYANRKRAEMQAQIDEELEREREKIRKKRETEQQSEAPPQRPRATNRDYSQTSRPAETKKTETSSQQETTYTEVYEESNPTAASDLVESFKIEPTIQNVPPNDQA